MLTQNTTTYNGGATRRRLPIACLVALLCLVLPATAWAASADPGYQGPEQCAQCHPAEATAWQHSPHAQAMTDIDEALKSVCSEGQPASDCTCLSCHTTDFDPLGGTYVHAGVTCEACHGSYVSDHPQSGVMQLDESSSSCQNCHATTYTEWKATFHAQSGVQCISCHQPHTQNTRLTDEALCGSCHRERLQDFAHTAHKEANVTCADCHLSSPSVHDTTAEVRLVGGGVAPEHSFTVVSQTCAGCHGSSIHTEAPGETVDQVYNTRLSAMTERTRELAYELEEAKRDNTSLKTMAVVSLGLGLGIGGMLGIIFVLVVGYINQGRAKR